MTLQLPKDWTAAILHPGGAAAGFGVLVKPNHVVTCAHVVARALGLPEAHPEIPRQPLRVRPLRKGGVETAGHVRSWFPVDEVLGIRQDICLLEVEDGSQALASWEDLLQQEPRPGHEVRAFGYKKGAPPGTHVDKYHVGYEVDWGWWEIRPLPSKTETDSSIDDGFSGSLVWDIAEDKAIGIVVAQLGANAYLIPSTSLREACAPEPPAPALPTQGPPVVAPRSTGKPARASAAPFDVFLCHASRDKPVVRQLANKLAERGLRVWFDEWSLRPGLPWQESLESAIRTVGSAAVLYGPSGIGPWADREMRAFLEESVQRRIPVIPVLLPGAQPQPELPLFLRAFTWVDLRDGIGGDGLGRLVWGITGHQPEEATPEAKPALFKLWNVPALPPEYQPRPELEALKAALLRNETVPVAVADEAVAASPGSGQVTLQGLGGVGKSVLAAALARDVDVRRAFPDGVYWMTLGQDPEARLLGEQSRLAAALGSESSIRTIEEGREVLRQALGSLACLLVLDDVWDPQDATPFNVLGERSRLLVTTRRQSVARSLGAEALDVAELPPDDALSLLARYARHARTQLPPEAHEVARECGELPLALAMVGSMMRGRPPERWSGVLERLRSADHKRIRAEFPGYAHTTLFAAIDASVADLEPSAQERYLDLAVFPEDTPVPEATLGVFWAATGLDPRGVEDLVDALVDRSLARRDARGRIYLHDLQRDFVRRQRGDLRPLHQRLLAGYRQAAPGGLHQGPHDGYFFEHLAEHLVAAEGRASLRNLLLDYRWLAAKLGATDTNALLGDYALLDLEADPPLRLLRDALRLSAHVLDRDPGQLAGQLTGRMVGLEWAEVGTLLERALEAAARPWLRPLWPSLTPPGGPLLRTLEGHQGLVSALATSADGTAISGSWDKTLKIWDLGSGQLLRTLDGHPGWVSAVAVSPNGTAISGSSDTTVKVWDLGSGQLLRTLEGHLGEVSAVAVSPDGTAISGSWDKTVKVWDLQSGRLLRTFEGHQGEVAAVAVSPNGKTAVSGSDDSTVKAWDLESGRILHTLEGHQSGVSAVAVSPDGKTAVSGSWDNTVKVWDLESGQPLRTLEGHQGGVSAVAVSPDGKTAVSGSDDRTVKVWDLGSGRLLRTLKGHLGGVSAVAVSADGKTAISGSGDRTVKVWDLRSGQLLDMLDGHQGGVRAVAMTPDRKTAVSGSDDTTVKVWDRGSGQLLHTLDGHQGGVRAVAMTPDGKTAVSGAWDTTLKVWNLGSGKLLRTLDGHQGGVSAVAVGPDGKTAISGSDDTTVMVWDLGSGKLLRTLAGHQGGVRAVAVSHDGQAAVSGSWDNTVKVWDLRSGQLLRTLEGHQGWVSAVAVSADGKTVVSGSDDRAVKVWDLGSGQLLRTLGGHQSWVHAVAVSPDGKTVVSGSHDRTVKVWDLWSGQPLATFTADASLGAVCCTANGIVAGDALGRVHLFVLER